MSRSVFISRIITGVLFLAAGIVTRVESTNLAFGSLKRIGPGFFPIIFGNLLIALSVILLASLWLQYRRGQVIREDAEAVAEVKTSVKGFLVFLGIMIGFLIINHFAGFIIATLFAILASGYALALKGWRLALLAVATTLVIWLVFDLWLMLSLPSGIWFS